MSFLFGVFAEWSMKMHTDVVSMIDWIGWFGLTDWYPHSLTHSCAHSVMRGLLEQSCHIFLKHNVWIKTELAIFSTATSTNTRLSNYTYYFHQVSPPWGPRPFCAWSLSFSWPWRPRNTASLKPPPDGKRNSWNRPSGHSGDERSGRWTNVGKKRQKVGVSSAMRLRIWSGA